MYRNTLMFVAIGLTPKIGRFTDDGLTSGQTPNGRFLLRGYTVVAGLIFYMNALPARAVDIDHLAVPAI
jgi:hypothetical protein